MTSREQALFAKPRGPVGATERALGTTLRAWKAREWLTGPEHAGRRAILRILARDLDSATRSLERGDTTEYSLAAVAREYRAALDAYSPPDAPVADPRAQALESEALSLLAAFDTADDEAHV